MWCSLLGGRLFGKVKKSEAMLPFETLRLGELPNFSDTICRLYK